MKQRLLGANLTDVEGRDVRDEADSALLAEARAGSEKAFRRLVERYHAMAYGVVRGILRERWDVEDVVQEVFIKVYRGLGGFRGDAKVSTWVYTIARNEAVNAARKRDPTGPPLENLVLETRDDERPDEQYRRKARHERLERCLSELEEDFRVALELRYMGEMSYQEIADTMGLPMGTVKTYIHRAKIELKRVMVRKQLMESHGKRERT